MNSLTSAVAAVIADPAGRILLCQQSQGHRLWALPGGKVRDHESPLHAAIRDIRVEVGADVALVELIGLYHLTGSDELDLPDVMVHVFRGRVDGEVTVNSPSRICHLSWHDPASLPAPLTATTLVAIDDAVAGRAGVLRTVRRLAEPDVPEAGDATVPAQPSSLAGVR
jgi:ADP-ribose pyrophosphatase YjhB (NUDIX family)